MGQGTDPPQLVIYTQPRIRQYSPDSVRKSPEKFSVLAHREILSHSAIVLQNTVVSLLSIRKKKPQILQKNGGKKWTKKDIIIHAKVIIQLSFTAKYADILHAYSMI